MHIVILGSRGIPAQFGGFETFAEQLAVRLVERGHRVTVFCEQEDKAGPSSYKGVELRYIRTPNIVGLRSMWADTMGILATLRGYDVVYMLGYHAAITFFIPALFRTNFWINMDGLEWKRSKWSRQTRYFLRFSEYLAVLCGRRLVADAAAIGKHLEQLRPSAVDKIRVIAYGAEPVQQSPADIIHEMGLTSGEYYLVVCRIEPENHVQEIIEGYLLSNSQYPLVVVGDVDNQSQYGKKLQEIATEQVKYVGGIYNQQRLSTVRQHCRAYLHGHSVGGTNPSLLEAMASKNYVIAHNNVFNREVLGELGDYFDTAQCVAKRIRTLEQNGIPHNTGTQLKERVAINYDWEKIVDHYVDEFQASL